MAITVTRTTLSPQFQLQSVTICFSGPHFWPIAGLAVLGGAAAGAVLGALVGIVAMLIIPNPEPFTKAAMATTGATLGGIVGTVLGTLFTAGVVLAGRCNCDTGLKAACITLIVYRGYLPVGIAPNPFACNTVTGC